MFALFSTLLALGMVSLCVSAGYFRTARAARVRLCASVFLFAGGLACAVGAAVMFYHSAGAGIEWAENAFSMFCRFCGSASAFVCVLLLLSALFGGKTRDRIVRWAVGILCCVGTLMVTGLFATLSNDADSAVHLYVQVYGVGCAALPAVFAAVEEIRFLRSRGGDKSAPAKNNNSK